MRRIHAVIALATLLSAVPALGKAVAPAAAPPPVAAARSGTGATASLPPIPPAGAVLQTDTGPSDGVAAIVNDAVVTEYDPRQRILLFVATSGLQATPALLSRLRGQALTQLYTGQRQVEA